MKDDADGMQRDFVAFVSSRPRGPAGAAAGCSAQPKVARPSTRLFKSVFIISRLGQGRPTLHPLFIVGLAVIGQNRDTLNLNPNLTQRCAIRRTKKPPYAGRPLLERTISW